MSIPPLPDFEDSLRLGQSRVDAGDLAECHGVLCGLLAVSPQADTGDYIDKLLALELLHEPGPAFRVMLAELFNATTAQLDDEQLRFRLWLPNDSEPLEERTEALARWCTGLLAGLAGHPNLEALSGESSEAVKDIEQIARAGLSAAEGDDAESLEADERAFTEIAEYVRVVALTLREDFRGPRADEAVH